MTNQVETKEFVLRINGEIEDVTSRKMEHMRRNQGKMRETANDILALNISLQRREMQFGVSNFLGVATSKSRGDSQYFESKNALDSSATKIGTIGYLGRVMHRLPLI